MSAGSFRPAGGGNQGWKSGKSPPNPESGNPMISRQRIAKWKRRPQNIFANAFLLREFGLYWLRTSCIC